MWRPPFQASQDKILTILNSTSGSGPFLYAASCRRTSRGDRPIPAHLKTRLPWTIRKAGEEPFLLGSLLPVANDPKKLENIVSVMETSG
jgi:hypothetical protein